jgi:hypothetical protein
MNDDLLCEVGVYYRHTNKSTEICPSGLTEFRYERFKDGQSYGIGRIFLLSKQPGEFLKLINDWNRRGSVIGYNYVAQI